MGFVRVIVIIGIIYFWEGFFSNVFFSLEFFIIIVSVFGVILGIIIVVSFKKSFKCVKDVI